MKTFEREDSLNKSKQLIVIKYFSGKINKINSKKNLKKQIKTGLIGRLK